MIIGARPASRKRGSSRQALAINDVENQVPSYAVSEGPAPAAANKDLLTDDVSPTKEECLEAISAIATEYKCPITHQLPIDPVKGEDGRTYERSALGAGAATGAGQSGGRGGNEGRGGNGRRGERRRMDAERRHVEHPSWTPGGVGDVKASLLVSARRRREY